GRSLRILGSRTMSSPQPVDPTLELIRGGRSERIYKLNGVGLDIGRDPGRDVRLDDVRVSRHHARVDRKSHGTCYLIDPDTKQSTRLDGRRLLPFEPTRLRDGSRIQIVDYELIFHDPASDPPDGAGGESSVLETLDDLSSDQLARRSSQTAEALRAVLEI